MAESALFDLAVVGCGAAGLTAAVAYSDAAAAVGEKARVALIEAAPRDERGGATRWTTSELRIDANDTLDPMWVGLMQEVSGGLADAAFCEAFEREIPPTMRFVKEHGVEILYSKPVVASTFPDMAAPNGGGRAIVDALAAYLENVGTVEFLYETEAVKLLVADDGRISGITVRGGDGYLRHLHARSVVVACGGFQGNPELLTRYAGPRACDLPLIAPGVAFNRGTGLQMVLEVGGDTAGQFDMIHSELVDSRSQRHEALIYGHAYGILVNEDGNRFINEGASTIDDTFEKCAFEVWKNQNQSASFITDSRAMDDERVKHTFWSDLPPIKADSLEALEVALDLEPGSLVHTVEEFNAACPTGEFAPDRLDGLATQGLALPKSNWATPIDSAPFYAYPLKTVICFTYGGVRTDTSARVVSRNGVPIPGLYAAGEVVGLFYHEYLSSTSVLKALTFGRIAGEHAASLR